MDQKVIQGLEVIEALQAIGHKSKVFQAKILQNLEDILGKDTPEYQEARKVVLDHINNYTRAVVKIVFGDIEYMMKP